MVPWLQHHTGLVTHMCAAITLLHNTSQARSAQSPSGCSVQAFPVILAPAQTFSDWLTGSPLALAPRTVRLSYVSAEL
jgi:hypothetical protein